MADDASWLLVLPGRPGERIGVQERVLEDAETAATSEARVVERRLFVSCTDDEEEDLALVQSVVTLTTGSGIVPGSLAPPYLRAMASLVWPWICSLDQPRVLVLGMGGGVLASHLRAELGSGTGCIVGVDYDAGVLALAVSYFGWHGKLCDPADVAEAMAAGRDVHVVADALHLVSSGWVAHTGPWDCVLVDLATAQDTQVVPSAAVAGSPWHLAGSPVVVINTLVPGQRHSRKASDPVAQHLRSLPGGAEPHPRVSEWAVSDSDNIIVVAAFGSSPRELTPVPASLSAETLVLLPSPP